MSDKQEELTVTFDSCVEVVPCPMEGHGYIDLARCKACDLHERVHFLSKSTKTGRDLNRVDCKYPLDRSVRKYMAKGIELVVDCPNIKTMMPLEECVDCEFHRGVKEEVIPVSLKPADFIEAVENIISGHQSPFTENKTLSVQCGKIVGRQCGFIAKGVNVNGST